MNAQAPGSQRPHYDKLFTAYSASDVPTRASIADRWAGTVMRRLREKPLVVLTSTHLLAYQEGRTAASIPFRGTTPGFRELTAVSHLAPALATIVALKDAGESWKDAADDLSQRCRAVLAVAGSALWTEELGVPAYAWRAEVIEDLVGFACERTLELLSGMLREPAYLSRNSLGAALGDPLVEEAHLNSVMLGTFALVGLATADDFGRALGEAGVELSDAQVVVIGQQGRPSAGLTASTNSVVRLLVALSGGQLVAEQVLMAPHVPGIRDIASAEAAQLDELGENVLWELSRVRASAALAQDMFPSLPRFVPQAVVGETAMGMDGVSEMPRITSDHDLQAMFTRLRLVLEDPRQQLSAGVTDYVAERLVAAGGNAKDVWLPGVDGIDYRAARSERGHNG